MKSACRGQLAALRPNLPAFNLNCSQQHKTEPWLTTGANGAGEEQVPSFSMGSGTHGSTGTVKKGGTRYRVPMRGKHGIRAIIILVFIYTQGKSSTSVTQQETQLPWPQVSYSCKYAFLSENSTLLGLVWNSTFYFP